MGKRVMESISECLIQCTREQKNIVTCTAVKAAMSSISSFVYVLLFLELLAGSTCVVHGLQSHPRNTLKDYASAAEFEASDGPKLLGNKKLPWKNLEYLDLRSNLLQGPVPAPSSNMRVFLISNNKFIGEIPRLICNTSTIEILDLSNNSLSGTIPECIGNFSKSLRVLDLRKNRFHGTIPETFPKGNNLTTLNFNGNELVGSVPRSLLNCANLQVLDLGNNKMKDTFPHWLGTLRELQVLILRSNKFYGHLRDYEADYYFSKLRILDLSNNNFTGSLPAMFFKNMKAMTDIGEAADENKSKYMGETYYEDSVTLIIKRQEVKLMKILTIFTTIDLSKNSFHGEIPELMGKLHSLRLLNLSQNILSGNIPSSLGDLTDLESLDLSSNVLDGVIPRELTRLTFLAVLNLSRNKLEGRIPEGNQFATFSSDSYGGNLGLCGFPLSKNCSNDEPPQSSSVLEDDSESEIGFGWKVVLMGYVCGTVFGMILGYILLSTGNPQWIMGIVDGKNHRKVRRQNKKLEGRRN
ncbi:Receptor-like protein 33 [Citrus sinensis]|uniref:Leucine-rich repeat-containing N-terminal plant-type domain-containing protein n=2 Tax=Citrus clementina TaxID=85681 RepID=V4VRI8_CITCL|nr:receptor-like protein 9DC3 [Citrus sinensis]ESR55639.1 hypothetical protein CICLE_v10019718mg [Citrus x clementina]KAH9723293.1 Receptor-like protein 33 [Citrus sinensis]